MTTGFGTIRRRRRGIAPSRVLRLGLLWGLNLIFLLFFLFPFYWQATNALKSPAEIGAWPIHWWPGQLYWGNFRFVLTNNIFLRAILNSLVVATSTTFVALLLGGCAAYALAQLPLPRKRSLLVGVLLAATLSPIVLVPSLYLVIRAIGLMDSSAALILCDTATALPFAIWVLTNTFRDIPAYLLEQAEVDGCTPLQALRRIVVPLAAPGLLAAGLLTFIMVWNELLFAITFTWHPSTGTVTVIILNYAGRAGVVAAASLVVSLPILVLALICQRGIVQGLTSGSIR